METARMKVGKRGEDIACGFLIAQGHTVLDRNWRSGHLEIDIISISDGCIHFTEVKTRVAPVSALPEENVGYTKQKRVAAAALRYLRNKKYDMMDISFDVISIVFDKERTDVSYFPQAFIPIYV